MPQDINNSRTNLGLYLNSKLSKGCWKGFIARQSREIALNSGVLKPSHINLKTEVHGNLVRTLVG